MTKNIKHIVITATAILGAVATVPAAAQTFFSQNWNEAVNALPEGWTTVGTDKTPTEFESQWFSKGEGWKVIEKEGYSAPFAASYSSTMEGGKVETWLISPEFRVPECGGFLEVPMWTLSNGETSACKMSVRISLSGASVEDFESSGLLTKRIKPSDGIVEEVISLSDFAGKDVRIAFVNEGTQAGVPCLGEVKGSICEYSVRNTTPLLFASGSSVSVKLDIDIRAQCKGFDATITTSGGKTSKASCNKDLSDGLKDYKLTFNCGIPAGDVLSYAVTITPRLEGVEPIVVTGSAAIGEGFPAMCLMEEATGENCGYCPAGTAAIERFSDMYPDRFVGVAVHCSDFSTGVMENPGYADPFMATQNIASLPSAVLNRGKLTNPVDYGSIDEAVKEVLKERSVARVTVDRVDCDMATGKTQVFFTSEMCAPLTGVSVNACVILSADDLTGTSRRWFQADYYSGTTEEAFLKQGDSSWWPYMKFWCEYPSKEVSPSDRSFNDVAMGIYPDFNGDGCKLPSDWSGSLLKSESISFSMPMQEEYDGFGVQKTENTAVTVILINEGDGSVIAAARVKAEDFNKDLSGVDGTADDDSYVRLENGRMTVYSADASDLSVFSVDGRTLHIGKVGAGLSVIDIDAEGIVIARLGDTIFKLMAR